MNHTLPLSGGPPPEAPVGERVRWARERLGISRNELDRVLDSGQGYTQKLEDGAIRRPGAHRMRAICDALGVSLDWLIGTGDPPGGDNDPAASIRAPGAVALRRRPSGEMALVPRRASGELAAVAGPTVPSPAGDAADPSVGEALDAALGAAFAADRHGIVDLMAARDALVRAGLAPADVAEASFAAAAGRVLDLVASLRREGRALSYATLLLRALASP